MEQISLIFQLIVAVSVLYIWIFRYDNIVVEFKHYGYSDLVRNFVGASKISISSSILQALGVNDMPAPCSLRALDLSKITHSFPDPFRTQPKVRPDMPPPIIPIFFTT